MFKAVRLTSEREKFLKLRKTLFLDAIKSPLFDEKKFARNFFSLIKEII